MLPIGIFAVITLGSLALLRVVAEYSKPGRGRLRRRLAGEFGESTPAESSAVPLYRNVASWDADLEDGGSGQLTGSRIVPAAGAARREWAEDFLREAGIPLKASHLAGVTLGAAVVIGSIAGLFVGWLAGVAAAVVGILVPLVVVNAMRKARRERYVKQLAGAFDLMARVLKAGQSVPEAFRAATEAFDDPLKGEFSRCNHQIEHGLRPETAYRELSQRSGVLELRIFVVAMTIQRQTGGNLSEVLERMAVIVRSRLRLRQKMRALTAEGRLQSVTLLVLPVLTFGVMYFLNRTYAEALLAQWRLLVATVACMGIGVLWIRNIMNFEG
ncbi:type II secretion system F family protein [Limnoglobus roseus]|uniref:Pilus assembly protein TadB n=1 Tax=Limnoglobus roseus TaxID=2598579 RepID=A0A5C1AUS2_9BACT|nr:type II secretion system F family protein [Limnoglobus roseus]QEL21014.1 pilus assembly protein TadB [Limnoglobus roseus]